MTYRIMLLVELTKVSEVEDTEKGEAGKKNCAEKRNDFVCEGKNIMPEIRR